jgi:hypothetical protein
MFASAPPNRLPVPDAPTPPNGAFGLEQHGGAHHVRCGGPLALRGPGGAAGRGHVVRAARWNVPRVSPVAGSITSVTAPLPGRQMPPVSSIRLKGASSPGL